MKVKLTVTAAFVIGVFVGAWFFSLRGTPTAEAQTRITLQSLQAQIDGMRNGDILVGNSSMLMGRPPAYFLSETEADARFLSLAAGDAAFLRKSGGTMSGPIVGTKIGLTSSIQVGNDLGTCATAAQGTVRWTGAKLQVCTGTGWVDLH